MSPVRQSLALGSSPQAPASLQRKSITREASPAPTSQQQRNHAVPFRRASESERRLSSSQPRTSTSLQHTRSLPACNRTISGFAGREPAQKVQGFVLPNSVSPPRSPRGTDEGLQSSPSLLTRQLSTHDVQQAKESLEQLHAQPAAQPAVKDAADLGQLQAQHPVFCDAVVAQAFSVAQRAYAGRSAAGGVPLLEHAVGMACSLAAMGLAADVVAAALLHDTLPKTSMTLEDLRRVTTPDVAVMVSHARRMGNLCEVYHDTAASRAGGAPLDHRKLTDTLMCMAGAKEVLLKLAERLQQLRHAGALQGDEQRRTLAAETMAVFSPLANRLGVWSMKAELEDLCFKWLHPTEYAELQQRLHESQDRGSIERALDQLDAALRARGLDHAELTGRPKNLWGVYQKMQAKGRGLDGVHDVRALRVIVQTKADCYAVLRQVHSLWEPVEGRYKDYIQGKKSNGYQSLHTVVRGPDNMPLEVQIRTVKMHFIAEYGMAAHWRYKERVALASDDERGVSRLVDLHAGWGRYLLQWQLEVNDHKCRPSGSPEGSSDGGARAFYSSLCASFPEHAPDCRFAEFVRQAKIAPAPVSQEVQLASPTNILLHYSANSRTERSIETLPGGTTPAQLCNLLQTGLHSSGHTSPYGLMMLVNGVEVQPGDERSCQPLLFGDQVEVWPADPPSEWTLKPKPRRPQSIAHKLASQRHAISGDYALPPQRLPRINSAELAPPQQQPMQAFAVLSGSTA